ncbi:hypothetical protein FB565_001518 [Actinoplanes lutulentus]|uniref:Uncharacterized protein n=1 Tax=Actinoplanes lutulentus TaxID=1287878 RepID=A0A327ZG01_9ACTN|nr:hypothetical protein [Actinoplanes lutulentus]MBB2941814.1 hypothetical protein [Actinoplanes lutulentus]RAK39733.1 hypothetical protein B0I29_104271 [Actinoplanes lutulentus]
MPNQPRVSSQPRLLLDTRDVIFELADDIVPKLDGDGVQKRDTRDTGLPMWTAPVFGRGRAVGKKWTAQLNITIVSAEMPDVQDGDQVIPRDLEALPWVSEQNGKTRSGVAFKASALEVVAGPTAMKAAA